MESIKGKTRGKRLATREERRESETKLQDEIESAAAEHRERLLFITDGVYAIALTLLALDLRLPAGTEAMRDGDLLQVLLTMAPKLLGYLTSFTVIGLFWSLNLRILRHVVRVDGAYIWLTLLQLGIVAFLPFPTTVVGEHLGDAVAEEFYYGSLALFGLVGAALLWYATWNRQLVGPSFTARAIHRYRLLAASGTLGLVALMILVALGLPRLVEPLVLGYLLTLGFIVEGIRFGRTSHQSRRAKVGA